MWRDHPIQPKEQTTERAVGVVVGADREVEGWGWTKFEKEGEGQAIIGGLHKIPGQHPSANYVKKL